MNNANAMLRACIVLTVLLIAGEVFRVHWFSESNGETSVDHVASSALRFDPANSNTESGPEILHKADPAQRVSVDRLLGHDRSQCGVWRERNRPDRAVYYTWVEYDAGNTRYLKDLFGHPPEICVGKSGATMVAVHPDRVLRIEGQEIQVRHVEFVDPISAVPFQIFKFTWLPDDSALQPGQDGSDTMRLARLRAAVHGMPRTEARMLIATVIGASDPEDGWQRFDRAMMVALSIERGQAAELATTDVVD